MQDHRAKYGDHDIDPDIDWLFVRLFAGRDESVDWATLATWAGEDAGRQAVARRIRTIATRRRPHEVNGGVEPGRVAAQQAEWKKILHFVQQQERTPSGGAKASAERRFGGRRGGHRRSLSAVVGGIALLAGGLVLQRAGHHAPSSASHVYRTVNGQHKSIRLADGSTMVLGPATSVIVSNAGVDVAGEAYFTVVPRASRPMIISTANAAVRVLGTSFLVRQYPNEPEAIVAVDNGKVMVQSRTATARNHSPAVVVGRMVATITKTDVMISANASTREYTSWTQGILVFHHAVLKDVVAELERVYGAKIRVMDTTLARLTLSGEVDVAQSSLTQVLDFISLTLNAHYQRDDDVYLLSPGREERGDDPKRLRSNPLPQPERQYGR